MKHKVFGIVLAVMMLIAVLPVSAPALAAPSEATVTAAFRAYLEILTKATADYGVGWSAGPLFFEGPDIYVDQGVIHAELIDFDKDGLPELLLVFSRGEHANMYFLDCEVYGYTAGGVDIFDSYWIGGEGGYAEDVIIMEDDNHMFYIQNLCIYESDDSEERFFHTVKNGQWVEVDGDSIPILGTRWLTWNENKDAVNGTLNELRRFLNAPAGSRIVYPTSSSVYINGAETSFDAYNIDDENYFKLRDVAYVLSGTEKQFNAEFISGQAILTSNTAYTPANQEMIPGDGLLKRAGLNTTLEFFKDGERVDVRAYLIGDNNYFRMRDILRLFNIGYAFDGGIWIYTAQDYWE